MTEEEIPYGLHWLDDEDREAVLEVLRSDRLTQGPRVAEFEEAVAAACGARFAVAFSSGTAALHGAMFAAGVGAGDEVVTTPLTFAATANCVLYQGGRPVFADVREATGNLDPERAAAALSPRTRAIIPVHFTGLPAEMEAFHELAERRRLVLVEDASHALGARYRGRPVGDCSLSRMAVFSFHPVKHVTTGEGGMVLTGDPELRRRLALFRHHGITADPHRLILDEGPWYYEMQALGYNYRLSDLQCALGMSQLRKLPRFLARRREIAARYREALAGEAALRLPEEDPGSEHAWHIFVVRLVLEKLTAGRRQVFEALRAAGLGVQVHYIPVHLHPYYRERLGHAPGDFRQAEEFYNRALTLPLYPRMTDEQVERVIGTVREVLGRFGK